jgi:hypothetical protein
MARYPWDEWLAGGQSRGWVAGVDFQIAPLSFQKQLQTEIRRRNLLNLTTRLDGSVVRTVQRNRRVPAHPWDLWLNGDVHVLQRGRDFEGSHVSFVNSAHRAARQRGLKVQTKTRGDKATGFRQVAIKAVPRA